jgi:hypothetical protein
MSTLLQPRQQAPSSINSVSYSQWRSPPRMNLRQCSKLLPPGLPHSGAPRWRGHPTLYPSWQRRAPIEHRKRQLAKLARSPHPGIVLNGVFEGDGHILFEHACKLGCEGIVSKCLGSPYRSGRSRHWLKIKNPKAPAVKREAEEDSGSAHWITVKSTRPQP